MNKVSELDPWRVICSELFNFSGFEIPEIIDKTGLVVDWALTDKQDYSHNTRKNAYRPRINKAYESLNKENRLRVAHITASELANRGKADVLTSNLEKIGWSLREGQLVPATADVSELFFPVGTQHDAYSEIKRLLQKATKSLSIIDPYVDSSLFKVLGTISTGSIEIKLLTYSMPSDFSHEAQIFLAQHTNIELQVKKSKEFHDRFVILDDNECWHVGASIKDAGIRAFMLNQVLDEENRNALISQLRNTWSAAMNKCGFTRSPSSL